MLPSHFECYDDETVTSEISNIKLQIMIINSLFQVSWCKMNKEFNPKLKMTFTNAVKLLKNVISTVKLLSKMVEMSNNEM